MRKIAILIMVAACSVEREEAVGEASAEIGATETLFAHQQPLRSVQCANGRIYWAEHYSGDVMSAALDGSDLRSEAAVLGPSLQAFAVDNAQVATLTPGTSGEIRSKAFAEVVPADRAAVHVGRDLDSVSGHLFWTTDATVESEALTIADTISPWSVRADEFYVYWSDLTNKRITRATHDGSAHAQIAGVNTESYTNIAIDSMYVYWIDGSMVRRASKVAPGIPMTLANDPDGPVMVEPIPGGAAWATAEKIKIGPPTVTIAGVVAVSGLAYCNGYLYWSTWTGELRRVPL